MSDWAGVGVTLDDSPWPIVHGDVMSSDSTTLRQPTRLRTPLRVWSSLLAGEAGTRVYDRLMRKLLVRGEDTDTTLMPTVQH
jgi:hypothetical protein